MELIVLNEFCTTLSPYNDIQASKKGKTMKSHLFFFQKEVK